VEPEPKLDSDPEPEPEPGDDFRELGKAARSSGLLTDGRSIRLVNTDGEVVIQTEDVFSCPICLSNTRSIREAVCLPECGHTFCDECLRQGFAGGATRAIKKCPTCGGDIPSSFIAGLKKRRPERSPPSRVSL